MFHFDLLAKYFADHCHYKRRPDGLPRTSGHPTRGRFVMKYESPILPPQAESRALKRTSLSPRVAPCSDLIQGGTTHACRSRLDASRNREAAMSPDQWQRIEELFEAALAEAMADRDEFVQATCVQDTATDTGTVAPLTGQNILHYQIVAKLGEGGMGVVYRALDTKLLRTVAIKLSSSALDGLQNDRKARLIREARAASAVNHPNIANVYEIG